MKISSLLIGAFLLIGSIAVQGQMLTPGDTVVSYEVTKPLYKPNVIKYNPTPGWVWDASSLMFGYERAIKPHQSIAVSVGYLRLPGLVKERTADTVAFNFERARASGYSLIAEYRFYIAAENKHFAPRGFFISPYFAHHNHWWESNARLDFQSGDFIEADINSHLVVLGVGAQLGYQFNFWKDRITLDLITFAPSYTFYELNLSADSNSSSGDLSDYYSELAQWMLDKYPWLESLAEDKLVDFRGNTNAFSAGVRFVIQVGFRF